MMKVLIADDEELIRNGLERIIHRYSDHFVVCGMAANGEDAMKLIKETHPDIVITDIKMPKMDGLELTAWINQYFPRVRHIILSGFNDVDLVRSCMRLGSVDYLLKPVNKNELFEVLYKLKKQIENERDAIRKEMFLEKALNNARENFLSMLVVEKNAPIEIISGFLDENAFNDSAYEVFLISPDTANDFCLTMPLSDDEKLLTYAIRNIAEELFINGGVNIMSTAIKSKYLIVFAEKKVDTQLIAESIAVNIRQCISHSVSIGISREHCGLENAYKAYQEAYKALNAGMVQNCGQVWHIDLIDANQTEQFEPKPQLIKKIAYCIGVMDKEKTIKAIDQVIEQLAAQSYVTQESIERLMRDIINRIGIVLKDAGIANNDAVFTKMDTIIPQCENTSQAKTALVDIANQAVDTLQKWNSSDAKSVIAKTKEYLEANYYKDITLNTIAKYLHMNPHYFSDFFKKETGENFLSYLTELRIEKARSLLKDRDLKSYEVANMVGYMNATYFSRIFKRQTGMTPQQYRNKHI